MEKWKKNVRNYFILSNSIREWVFAIVLLSLLTLFFVEYHAFRGRERFDLYTLNKGISLACSLLIISSMFFSPIAQLTGRLKSIISFRRPLGVVGVIGALIHIFLSLFFIPKYDLEWYLNPANYAAIFSGAFIMVIFCIMWYYSYPRNVKRAGISKVRTIHRFGYIGIMGIMLHMASLGKLQRCIEWTLLQDKPYPPGTYSLFIIGTVFFFIFGITAFKRRNN